MRTKVTKIPKIGDKRQRRYFVFLPTRFYLGNETRVWIWFESVRVDEIVTDFQYSSYSRQFDEPVWTYDKLIAETKTPAMKMHNSTQRDSTLLKATLIAITPLFPVVIAATAIWWVYDRMFGFGAKGPVIVERTRDCKVVLIEIEASDMEPFLA